LLFGQLADFYERIEATTKRLEMTDLLASLFAKTPPEIIDKVAYLTLGQVYPAYVGVELGLADKLVMRTLGKVTGASAKKLSDLYARFGDLGIVGEMLLGRKQQSILAGEPLTVDQVYSSLGRIAAETGTGSVESKLNILAGLLAAASPLEAKHIIRIVTGKMRLGIADMTIIDALSTVFGGGKETREAFERAYNLSSDIGIVAKEAATNGLEGIRNFRIRVGRPVRAALAERLSSAAEILEKLDGKGFAEYKYDGERMQVHKSGRKVYIFSRRQENITGQYPDVVGLVQSNIKPSEAILECEAVAVDASTGEMLPFQELMHRRRKKDIEKAVEEYPLALFFFDILLADGRDFTLMPQPDRRRMLEDAVIEDERCHLSRGMLVEDEAQLDSFFHESVEAGCEGVIVKSVATDSTYRAGARGWVWIKYKRDYMSEMVDTVDLVVVGGFHGRGRRSGKYGALLMAAYNPARDVFQTVCKLGSGFKDEDLEKLRPILSKHIIPHRHARVDSLIEPDVFFEPKEVLEVIGAEVTVSPTHTCGWDTVRRNFGLAIRFPRFTGRMRFDKSAEDATTTDEIVQMYKSQLKRVSAE